MSLTLVIGNKNYSSWSLRPWLAMKVLGLAFDEKRIPLDTPGTKQEILRYSPAGKVPCLVDGSLAISTGPVFDPSGKAVASFTSVWRQESPGVWHIVFDKGCNCP